MKRIVCFLIVCAMCFQVFGCATARDTGATAGGVLGAGVGAAISKKNPWLGALIGGAVGAITGGVIGNYMDEQKKNRQDSMKDIKYTAKQGQVVRIDNAKITPVTVKPGESVGLHADYYVLSPDPKAKVKIKETRIIKYNNEELMDPIVREAEKDQGLASSTAKLTIPKDAQPGEYEVITIIDNGSKSDKSTSKFHVQKI